MTSQWPQVWCHYRKDLDSSLQAPASTCQQVAATLGRLTCQAVLDLQHKEAKPRFPKEPILPAALHSRQPSHRSESECLRTAAIDSLASASLNSTDLGTLS